MEAMTTIEAFKTDSAEPHLQRCAHFSHPMSSVVALAICRAASTCSMNSMLNGSTFSISFLGIRATLFLLSSKRFDGREDEKNHDQKTEQNQPEVSAHTVHATDSFHPSVAQSVPQIRMRCNLAFALPGLFRTIKKPLRPVKGGEAFLQPIEPSISSLIRRFISTAYSIGSSLVNGSMKPMMIIWVASASDNPRLIR